MPRVFVTHFSDPGCPWAWSASPAIAALMWRYGDQLKWRHVMIGLTESGRQYEERGYTPLKGARGYVGFRRFGMPFGVHVKDHVAGTSRACRAVVAARLQAPEREWAVFRALQLMQFTTPGLLDVDEDLRRTLQAVPGVDAEALVAAIDDPAVVQAYERDRAEARSAENTPAHAQDKTAQTDGPVRFTAPTLVFEAAGSRLTAGGFQSLMVYDTLLTNLAPALERRPAPGDPAELLAAFPDGLTSAEVAEVYAEGPALERDRDDAEERLLGLVAEGRVVRLPAGDDALWLPAGVAAASRRGAEGRFAAVRRAAGSLS